MENNKDKKIEDAWFDNAKEAALRDDDDYVASGAVEMSMTPIDNGNNKESVELIDEYRKKKNSQDGRSDKGSLWSKIRTRMGKKS